jgi:hypothetical protein
MARLNRFNVSEAAEKYGVSRRRHINRVLKGQTRRIEDEMLDKARKAKKEAQKQFHGYGKDAGWLATALSFIPAIGPAASAAFTIANERKKRKQHAAHTGELSKAYHIPKWAQDTFMEDYAQTTGDAIGRQALSAAEANRKMSNTMGWINMALSAVPVGGQAAGTWGKKIVGKKTPLGGLGKKVGGKGGLLDSLLEKITGKEGLVGTLTSPAFKTKTPGFLGFGGKTQYGLFPGAKSKFVQNIGARTSLAHLAQPGMDPLQKYLIDEGSEQEPVIQGLQAPRMRRRY